MTTGDDAVELGFDARREARQDDASPPSDNRGFIVNRLLVPYMLDAIRAYEQGVGSIEDIDTGMMAGASHPMGPLTLADFVGLDTLASIAGVMHDDYGEERFAAPADAAESWSTPGNYGRKSGQGLLRLLGEKPAR